MKLRAFLVLCLMLLLTACTPYMYGVPQENWDRMSENERIEAMRSYEREQDAQRRAAEERARYEAVERQREQARQAVLERERLDRIERIHSGRGAYGELIRVRLQGGGVMIGDRPHHYAPVTFTIADGEMRKIVVLDPRGRTMELEVSYAAGTLSLQGVGFAYDRSWGRGRIYGKTVLPGPVVMGDVDVFVEVYDRSSRSEREQPRMVVVREPIPLPAPVRHSEPVKPPLMPRAAALVPRSIDVTLQSGAMKVRGIWLNIERTSLRLSDGEHREVAVKAGNEIRIVEFSYAKGVLVIDGSPGHGGADVRLPHEPEWRGGKTYRIGLKGRAALEQLELKVTGSW